MIMWQKVDFNGFSLWQVTEWRQYGWLQHGFTTGQWGNLALHVGDNHEAVLQRRAALAAALGFDLDSWVIGDQVHGDYVQRVDLSHRGRGAKDQTSALPNTDGLLTDQSGLLLVSFYADCVPLLFVVPNRRVIGTAHAGWRGTAQQIAVRMVDKLRELYCIEPDQIQVGIGPAIGQCCYQVSPEVAAKFPLTVQKERAEGIYLDLAAANKQQLVDAGVTHSNIYVAHVCTHCHQELYSYRRDGAKAGRMAAFIGINW